MAQKPTRYTRGAMPCASRFTYPKILCGAMMTMNSKPYTVKSHRLRVRCSSCLYPNCSTDPFSSAIVTSTNVDSTFAARNKRAGTSARGPSPRAGFPPETLGRAPRFPYTKRPALSGEAVPSRFPPFSPFGKLETYFSPPSLRGGKAIAGGEPQKGSPPGILTTAAYQSVWARRCGARFPQGKAGSLD